MGKIKEFYKVRRVLKTRRTLKGYFVKVLWFGGFSFSRLTLKSYFVKVLWVRRVFFFPPNLEKSFCKGKRLLQKIKMVFCVAQIQNCYSFLFLIQLQHYLKLCGVYDIYGRKRNIFEYIKVFIVAYNKTCITSNRTIYKLIIIFVIQ